MTNKEAKDYLLNVSYMIGTTAVEYMTQKDGDKIREAIKTLTVSSAQPEQRWIPVSERLPEDEYVLISKIPTKISGNKWSVAIAIRTADPRSRKIQWRDSGFGVIQDDKVLAWMPLPEPYKAESEVINGRV